MIFDLIVRGVNLTKGKITDIANSGSNYSGILSAMIIGKIGTPKYIFQHNSFTFVSVKFQYLQDIGKNSTEVQYIDKFHT